MLYLATDEDREGESISWHLAQVLRPKVPQRRLVFHEITREAIEDALRNPRELDERLVKAQETRRILDRLYGYEISPILWRKIKPRLSAGRVQSVAVKLVVERARQRQRFVRSTFWDLRATFATLAGETFEAELVTLGGQRLVAGRDFDPATGELKPGAGRFAGRRGAGRHQGAAPSARRRGALAGRAAQIGRVPRRRRRGEALHHPSVAAVHHLDAPAGGEPQATLRLAPHHADRAAPLRERPHHLHAHRLDHAGGLGGRAHPRRHQVELRRRSICRDSRASTRPRSRTRRRRTRRSAPRACSRRRASSSASSRPTSCGSTS